MKRDFLPLWVALLGLFGMLSSCSLDNNGAATATTTTHFQTPTGNSTEVSATDDAEMLKLSASLGNSYYVPNGSEEYMYYMVKIKTGHYEPTQHRSSLNISLVIDRSGSMSAENKLNYAKQAAQSLLSNLGPNDRLSLVTYDDRVTVPFKSALVTDKNKVSDIIKSLYPGGSTDLGGGMSQGYEEVISTYDAEYVNRVLLLSDGLANVGITDERTLMNIAQDMYRNKGVSISTFGVGVDFNEDLMTGLAESGRGNYYYIDNAQKIQAIFEKEMNGLLSVVAQNVKLEIDYPSDRFEVVGVDGYQYTANNGKLVLDLNNMTSEEEKVLLVKFKLTDLTDDAYKFGAKLSYTKSYDNEKPGKLVVSCDLKRTTDTSLLVKSANDDVYKNALLYESNELYKQAIKSVDKGDLDKAREYLEANDVLLTQNSAYVNSDSTLMRQKVQNTIYTKDVEEYNERSEYERKDIQKTNKSELYKSQKRKD